MKAPHNKWKARELMIMPHESISNNSRKINSSKVEFRKSINLFGMKINSCLPTDQNKSFSKNSKSSHMPILVRP
jgi:hypothetical protein